MAEFHRESLIRAQGATTEGHLIFLLAGPVAVYLCFLVCLFTFLFFDFNSYFFFFFFPSSLWLRLWEDGSPRAKAS